MLSLVRQCTRRRLKFRVRILLSAAPETRARITLRKSVDKSRQQLSTMNIIPQFETPNLIYSCLLSTHKRGYPMSCCIDVCLLPQGSLRQQGHGFHLPACLAWSPSIMVIVNASRRCWSGARAATDRNNYRMVDLNRYSAPGVSIFQKR